MPTGDGHWDEDLSWCYHWSHPGHTQMIPDEYAVNQRNGEDPSSKIIQAKSFLGNQRNSSFFFRRGSEWKMRSPTMTLGPWSSWSCGKCLAHLVVNSMVKHTAFTQFDQIWPCGPCGGSWEPYSKRGFVHLFSIERFGQMCWARDLRSWRQSGRRKSCTRVGSLGDALPFFLRSDPDQILIRWDPDVSYLPLK